MRCMQEAVEKYHLENEVTLTGSFCLGKCNPIGVTVQVDDEIYTGITTVNFSEFFKAHVLEVLHPNTVASPSAYVPLSPSSYSCASRAS